MFEDRDLSPDILIIALLMLGMGIATMSGFFRVFYAPLGVAVLVFSVLCLVAAGGLFNMSKRGWYLTQGLLAASIFLDALGGFSPVRAAITAGVIGHMFTKKEMFEE